MSDNTWRYIYVSPSSMNKQADKPLSINPKTGKPYIAINSDWRGDKWAISDVYSTPNLTVILR
ncbi:MULTISPECIES: hypothetical protein [Psychrobacter]|uniref:hypothetical protein n=1 Tax=Psychrobacter TaxID=497 RepID=UPI000EC11036|nr:MULTISPECIES: hypothetical protein [Psychrobacter]HCH26983.1 hypothetical protein [Psychrobacter sp.]